MALGSPRDFRGNPRVRHAEKGRTNTASFCYPVSAVCWRAQSEICAASADCVSCDDGAGGGNVSALRKHGDVSALRKRGGREDIHTLHCRCCRALLVGLHRRVRIHFVDTTDARGGISVDIY